jgi:prepilin-type N-terminal cleavage/methylation domain-containing protein/prepilin-type processing-associated H-X9-DG protein
MNKRQKGFTLIELLVVIAVIAILAAILFPVITKAKEKGRQTQCISNMKQIGLSINQYMSDYDDVLPPPWYSLNDYTDGFFAVTDSAGQWGKMRTWMDLTYPQHRNFKLFKCPSQPSRNYGDSGEWSYIYNIYPWIINRTKMANIRNPSAMFLLGHSTSAWYCYMYPTDMAWYQDLFMGYNPQMEALYQTGYWMFPHNGGQVFLYADGHAKWLTGTDREMRNADNYWFLG